MEFLTAWHKANFIHLLEEAYLDSEKMIASSFIEGDSLLKRQLAFLYMIAYYQEDYRQYEGEAFYIECFEEMEIGGPTYLLEEEVSLREDYPHEKVLHYAKALLIGGESVIEQCGVAAEDQVIQKLYENACVIANN